VENEVSCPVCLKNHKPRSTAWKRCQVVIGRVLAAHARSAERERLEDDRSGPTHRFTIGDLKGYVTVNTYPGGRPGEVFCKMDRQGSTVSGFVDSWAIALSLALQYGVPLKVITDKFKAMRFEPEGMTSNPEIRIAQSPVDYSARWMEMRFEQGS
jgi:ribonucleoside-diphosphate reductase alpha chain